MKLFIRRVKNFIKVFQRDDPVKSCKVYRTQGCSHVDGPLCDMKTCDIRKDKKE